MIKTALSIALICASAFCVEVSAPPKENTLHEELDEIWGLMQEVGNDLRSDRTDKITQLKGKEIDDRITKLIKEIDCVCDDDETERGRVLKRLKNGNLTPICGMVTKSKEDRSGAWRPGLDKDSRGKIVQVWAADIPVKWRIRIEAYFYSICAEEAAKK